MARPLLVENLIRIWQTLVEQKKRTLKLQLQHRANQRNGAIQQCDQFDRPTRTWNWDGSKLLNKTLFSITYPPRGILSIFWHAYSPGMSSWNPGPDQVSPESSGEGAVDSSNNTLHTPGPSTAVGISGALFEELFYEQYFSGNSSIPDDAARLLRDSLLVNAMLALVARFSSAPHLNQKPNVDKGEEFAESAKDMYYYLRAAQKNTLEFLQVCTLLAFQLYLHGPTTEGWMVIGTCTRLANELGLHAIDFESESDVFSPVSLEWSKKEGLRRVWWSVWELDTFSAAVACRPHTIDRMTMQVKLPVSDKNWFADMLVESSIINHDPVHSWHTLRDCPNQDERAWFLLINYLLLTAHDLGQQQNLQRKEIQEIEKVISCYILILPPQFNLLEDLNPSSFRPNRVSNFNWIIVTNIMLQG
ncbi:hypothetical protein FOXG_04694 [Fusarium oxysporum f. sp. lycopersici 4287]|uniref:Xylanolytic transcriptional activator regulatory domain-containing protein n=2 Tax=Fusarium oxysporum TaxID=5507 RepID=A0A0J9UQ79_FUSO4|nr:hypothetical protein FOXG_04694 [Fusarium oxysporum f. sp. lycopersici 4287]KNB01460.1 hypothetical protein FOXG_04694 [Fusarium oxysporum f. sp. lycopersici 4287]